MASSLWTTPVEDLTFGDVLAFCAEQWPESLLLEYKSKWSANDAGGQAAKEVCAFANTRGGLLVYGVEEHDRLPCKEQNGCELGGNPRQCIIDACNALIWPPPPIDVSPFLPNPDDSEKGFVVVRVPPSDKLPHAVKHRTRVYMRQHDHSDPIYATIDQIEHMLNERRQFQSLQRQRVDYSIDCMRRTMGLEPTDPALFVAIGPVFGFEPRLSDDECYRLMREAGVRAKLYSPGAYAFILMDGEEVVALDRWGNSYAAIRLAPMSRRLELTAERRGLGAFPDIEESADRGEWDVVPGGILAGAIVRAVKIAMKANANGVGSEPIEARMIATRVCRTMISPGAGGMNSLGYLAHASVYNQAEDTMIVGVPTRLEAEDNRLSRELVVRLFRAWGSKDDTFADVALSEFAEGNHDAFWR